MAGGLKRILAAAVLMAALMHPATADEGLSNLLLQGGLFGGATFHSADFRELPGAPNCCVTFGSGVGFGLDINFGAEFDTKSEVFNGTLRLGATVGYQLLSGTMTESEVVGNIIDGETVTDGVVQHDVELGYGLIAIRPYAAVPMPVVDGLFLTGGVLLGIPISTTIDQSQTLVEPKDDRYTFENGQRTRNKTSGELPDKSSLYAAVDLGFRYDVQLNESWTIAPAIRYQLGLTDIMVSTPWTISSFFGGVTLQVRLPNPTQHSPPVTRHSPPPPPPPPPPVVKVERVVTSRVLLASTVKGAERVNDTVRVPALDVVVSDTLYNAAPVIFFEKNSTQPLIGDGRAARYQQDVIRALRGYMRAHPDVHLTVTGVTARDEDKILAKERIQWAIRQLPIDQNHITLEQLRGDSLPYADLNDEFRRVQFRLDSTDVVIPVVSSSSRSNSVSIPMAGVHTLVCTPGPCNTTANAYAGDSPVPVTMQNGVATFTVPRKVLNVPNAISVSIRLETMDADSTSVIAEDNISLLLTERSFRRSVSRITVDGVLESNDRILGYFDFDESSFSSHDPSVVAEIKAALENGKRVVVIPSTDTFGNETYNRVLKQQRADAAITLLGAPRSAVDVDLESVTMGPIDTPMQRIASRSVRVRILE